MLAESHAKMSKWNMTLGLAVKGGCQPHRTAAAFLSTAVIDSPKQFPQFIERSNPYVAPKQPAPTAPLPPKKKKKRRRRRKKKRAVNNAPEPAARQRHDSFLIVFDDLDSSSESLVPTQKKVRFADNLCEVHPMIAWSFAYHAARKGDWAQHCLDRCRFQHKIREAGREIEKVLGEEHRARIYQERFLDNSWL